MAITTDPVAGFFSTTGTLKSDSLRSSGFESSQNSKTNTSSAVQGTVATVTASAIADAAVATVTTRFNSVGTGFGDDSAAIVELAVQQGLENRARRTPTYTSGQGSGAVGGTYQNQILYGSQSAVPTVPTVSAETPDNNSGQPAPALNEDSETRKLARQYLKDLQKQAGRRYSESDLQSAEDRLVKRYGSTPDDERKFRQIIESRTGRP